MYGIGLVHWKSCMLACQSPGSLTLTLAAGRHCMTMVQTWSGPGAKITSTPTQVCKLAQYDDGNNDLQAFQLIVCPVSTQTKLCMCMPAVALARKAAGHITSMSASANTCIACVQLTQDAAAHKAKTSGLYLFAWAIKHALSCCVCRGDKAM